MLLQTISKDKSIGESQSSRLHGMAFAIMVLPYASGKIIADTLLLFGHAGQELVRNGDIITGMEVG